MPAAPKVEYEIMRFASSAAFAKWLHAHHARKPGLWLQIAKKAAGHASVDYAQALEIALCYGWIDGQRKGLDEAWFLQKFTPRGAKSMWSKVNRDKVASLIERGLMKPAGHAAIEAAKRDGRWEAAYDSPRTITVPDDLQRFFDRDPAMHEHFIALSSQNRFAVLHRLQTAKKPETRARRLEQFVQMLKERRSVY